MLKTRTDGGQGSGVANVLMIDSIRRVECWFVGAQRGLWNGRTDVHQRMPTGDRVMSQTTTDRGRFTRLMW